jgi:NAD(P)-dependent dehydrogenase (short-subunit alcohol dehydrogenase family)
VSIQRIPDVRAYSGTHNGCRDTIRWSFLCHADYALCRNLAAEWGPDNLRVNCIAPGLVKAEFARVLYQDPQRGAAREAATPLRHLGEPEDIGGVALLLASRAGAFITGQTITVNGGTTIAP